MRRSTCVHGPDRECDVCYVRRLAALDYAERDGLRAQLATVTAEKDKALAAARSLRVAAERVHAVPFAAIITKEGKPSAHIGTTDIAGAVDAFVAIVDALNATAWLDEGEGKP